MTWVKARAFRRRRVAGGEAGAMHLVQFFLPLRDNEGKAFGRDGFAAVRRELADRFGGVTAWLSAPAQGLWEDAEGDLRRDEVLLVEVMDADIDRAWWRAYRGRLETAFQQEKVLMRVTEVEVL